MTRSYVIRFRGGRSRAPNVVLSASSRPPGVPYVDEAPRVTPYVYS